MSDSGTRRLLSRREFGGAVAAGAALPIFVGPNFRVGAPDVEQHGSPLAPTNKVPPVPELDIPTFRAAGPDPKSWIKPCDKPHVFRRVGQRKDVTLVPLNSLFDHRYAVYWQVR